MNNIFLTYKINLQKHANIIKENADQDLFYALFNNTIQETTETKTNLINYTRFYTIKTDTIAETPTTKSQAEKIRTVIHTFARQLQPMVEKGIETYYRSFKIPKRNGKMRPIDEPDPASLKIILRNLKDAMQYTLQCLPHDAAYAYIPQRSALQSMQKHQANESKWYENLDLTNFFPSCSKEFIHKQLAQIYPFCIIYNDAKSEDLEAMKTIIDGITIRNGLPEGSPLSPFLTNLLMIPVDYEIYNLCKQYNKQHFCYTRYSDDITISSKYDFDYIKLQNEIEKIITNLTPIKLNKEKTLYGSTAGSNWNLGLITNKDNNITIGYRRKRAIKQKLLNFCTNTEAWDKDELRAFHGELTYFLHIEPEYATHVIEEYSRKYNENNSILEQIRKLI